MNKEQLDSYITFAKDKLNVNFKDINLLIIALTHRSYVNEHKKSATDHNERLEFLGDAVLELVATDFLYATYNEPEGVLTNWRAALVRTESIGAAADKLGFLPLIRMSKGEKHGSDRAHQVIMADAFEAVIGAIYLDQGYPAAAKFIEDNILSKMDTILAEGSWRDPKSHLQELAQRADNKTPIYKVLKEDGPDHDKTFTVGAYVGPKLKGTGTGHSKQEAQVRAAEHAIQKYTK
ncbi:ribonuclease III [Christensenellaceae bacterium OttesenSCG-928-L17]|nr:ribonuclease III [Christensenellaceae bacterium OttesenSCG-928-L17]